jgi:hypothetical protein
MDDRISVEARATRLHLHKPAILKRHRGSLPLSAYRTMLIELCHVPVMVSEVNVLNG